MNGWVDGPPPSPLTNDLSRSDARNAGTLRVSLHDEGAHEGGEHGGADPEVDLRAHGARRHVHNLVHGRHHPDREGRDVREPNGPLHLVRAAERGEVGRRHDARDTARDAAHHVLGLLRRGYACVVGFAR